MIYFIIFNYLLFLLNRKNKKKERRQHVDLKINPSINKVDLHITKGTRKAKLTESWKNQIRKIRHLKDTIVKTIRDTLFETIKEPDGLRCEANLIGTTELQVEFGHPVWEVPFDCSCVAEASRQVNGVVERKRQADGGGRRHDVAL